MTSPDARYSEIETLIRARYPLIHVLSWEEGRVREDIERIARTLNKKIYIWTVNEGIRAWSQGLTTRMEGKKGTRDPLMALREIMAQTDPAIYILHDFHPYMNESAIARGLRDLSEQLRATYTSVVLTSPAVQIPPDLEKDITLVDYDLPDAAELGRLLHSIAEDLSDQSSLTVDLSNGGEETIVKAAVGLTLNEAENVFAKTLVSAGRLSVHEVPLIFGEKEQIVRKTGLLEYVRVHQGMEDVGGLGVMKDWLAKRRLAFSDEARRYGLPPPKGVLILGVQGCGKSLCAKAVPGLWQLPLLRLDMGRLFGSLVGSSEHNVRRAIQLAESVQPVVLWVDEIDKGFSGLESSSLSDSGTTARVFGTLLTWLQEKESEVFVIATANNVEVLPPELLRKGRFDEIFFVDLPSVDERRSIFRIHLEKRRRQADAFKLDDLAAATDGFSGAEIEQAVISAMFDSFSEKTELTSPHVLNAIRETVPLSQLMDVEIQRRREWARGRTRPAS